MEYQVLTYEHSPGIENQDKEFQERVNARIEEGWTPEGGVSVSTHVEDGTQIRTYAQALVKTPTSKEVLVESEE